MPSAPPIDRLEQVTHARRVDIMSLDYCKYVSELYKADGMSLTAWANFTEHYPRRLDVIEKAAVAAGTTTDTAWAKPLAQPQVLAQAFLEYALPASVIGKLSLRKVPFNTPVAVQSAAATYKWVGENNPKPVTKLQFTSTIVPPGKALGILVVTKELLRLSVPSAVSELRRALADGLRAFLDGAFLDPAIVAVAGVSPGSVTNGITGIVAGTDPKKDLTKLVKNFTAAHKTAEGAALVLSEANATAITMTSPGVLTHLRDEAGLTIVLSAAAGSNIVMLAPRDILLADAGDLELAMSKDATLAMDDAPTTPDATTVYLSLWQNNLIGLRAEQTVSWQRTSSAAVAYLSGADYTV